MLSMFYYKNSYYYNSNLNIDKSRIRSGFLDSLNYGDKLHTPAAIWMVKESVVFIGDVRRFSVVLNCFGECPEVMETIWTYIMDHRHMSVELIEAFKERITPEVLGNILRPGLSIIEFAVLNKIAERIVEFPKEQQNPLAQALFSMLWESIRNLHVRSTEFVTLLTTLIGLYDINVVLKKCKKGTKQMTYEAILCPSIATTVSSALITEAIVYFSQLITVHKVTIPIGFTLKQFSGKKLCQLISFLSKQKISSGAVLDIPSVESFQAATLQVQLGKDRQYYNTALKHLPILQTRNAQGETFVERFKKIVKNQTPEDIIERFWGCNFSEVADVFEYFNLAECRDEGAAEKLCKIFDTY